ncbi:hypothetical protein PYCCODRAFT_1043881 [Trametes coccinea BRFM310]|uniref:F-box domain-containing protein n=1 Tax=Trametes coccinea (strain BRFM310) TaxID=1353009 RepID=A0A1Y2ICA5_TRAC3|nr:hypothetical protein PYCCODRAFT_1043881 [Trametes coccinea BRFM310]
MTSQSTGSNPVELNNHSLSSEILNTMASTHIGNLDILRLILACLPQQDLLKATYVSRLFREEACQLLLMRPIRLSGQKRLLSFNHFIHSFGISQLYLVRALAIEHIDGRLEEEVKAAFFQVVTNCTQLRSLELLWCDAIVGEEVRIVEALSSFKSLTRFIARTITESDTLYAIIYQAVISMKYLRALAEAHPSVEKLGINAYTLAGLDISLPSVRTLHISMEREVPSAANIHGTFPNLQHLRTTIYTYTNIESFPESLGSTGHGSDGTWVSLDSLRSSATGVYAMGLVCPVRDLDLEYYEVSLHARIIAILARLLPRKFSVTLYCAPNWEVPPDEPRILAHDEKSPGVKYLHLRMTFTSLHVPDTADVLRYVLPFLSASSVEFLQLTISPYNFSDDPENVVNPKFPVEPELAMVAETVQVEALVEALAASCPSLRALSTTVFRGEHIVWRIVREDGAHSVNRLHPYEGRLLMQQEQERCLDGGRGQ